MTIILPNKWICKKYFAHRHDIGLPKGLTDIKILTYNSIKIYGIVQLSNNINNNKPKTVIHASIKILRHHFITLCHWAWMEKAPKTVIYTSIKSYGTRWCFKNYLSVMMVSSIALTIAIWMSTIAIWMSIIVAAIETCGKDRVTNLAVLERRIHFWLHGMKLHRHNCLSRWIWIRLTFLCWKYGFKIGEKNHFFVQI